MTRQEYYEGYDDHANSQEYVMNEEGRVRVP